jgi:O-antigen ligase
MRLFDYLIVGLVLVYVWRIQDLFPILGTLEVPTILSLAGLGVFFLGGHAARGIHRFRQPAILAGIFIAIWMGLSVPGSVHNGRSFSFLVNDHLKTFLVMLMVLASIRSFRDVERLALAHIVGATIYCVRILTTFTVEPSGRLGNLFFYDSNDLALFIVCTIPLALYFVGRPTRMRDRLLAAAALAVFMVAIVKTGSRGGFVGLVAVGLFLVFGFKAVSLTRRLSALAVAAVVLNLVAGSAYWDLMGTMLNPTEDYNWSGNADAGRMAIWERGLGYMAENPLFGVGVKAFPVAEGTISPIAGRQQLGIGVKWAAAHNSFVEIGAELGIPGLIAFVLLFWYMVKACRTVMKRASRGGEWPNDASLAQAFIGTIIGYAVSGFFLSQAYSAFLYVTAGIIVGLAAVRGREQGQPSTGSRRVPVGSAKTRRRIWGDPRTDSPSYGLHVSSRRG